MTGIELTFAGLIKLLILPLKILSIATLATFSRIFHDKEKTGGKVQKITTSLVLTRITMSLFVLLVVFYTVKHWVKVDETTALLIAGGFAFAFREVMDTFLLVAKNPSSIKNIFKGSNKRGETIDPKGDDYPDGEGKK